MQEAFLEFVWQNQLFSQYPLRDTRGKEVQLYSPGQKNPNAGPDFSLARLSFEAGVELCGTVELHLRSSAWHQHKHTHDAAFNNVILHVVWEHDENIYLPDGSFLPTVEVKSQVKPDVWERYWSFLEVQEAPIPCGKYFAEVPQLQRMATVEQKLVERLERKAQEILERHSANNGDWEETAYQTLAKNFGFHKNAEPFLQLAESLPLKILKKHKDQRFQIEALLFGMAGLLREPADQRSKNLQTEFFFLAQKYQLKPRLNGAEWKWAKMRPSGFPSMRLAQLAALIQQHISLFNVLLNIQSAKEFRQVLAAEPDKYWRRHYILGKEAQEHSAKLGKAALENLIINSVAPFLAAYSIRYEEKEHLEKAVRLLEQLPAEKNSLIQTWKNLGATASKASDSQGLKELYSEYCQRKKCLSCGIGRHLLHKSGKG